MNRARDSQRSKLYKAERDTKIMEESRRFDEMPELTARVKQITSSLWWQDRAAKARHRPYWWGRQQIGRVTVFDGRGCRSALAFDSSIKMPRWARSEIVLLHELAHILTKWECGRKVAAHGREFCMTYLALVRRFIGKEAHDELRDSFKRHKVKYRPKVQLSPEERQRRRERALALAANRPILAVE